MGQNLYPFPKLNSSNIIHFIAAHSCTLPALPPRRHELICNIALIACSILAGCILHSVIWIFFLFFLQNYWVRKTPRLYGFNLGIFFNFYTGVHKLSIFFHSCLKIEANKIWKELSALYTLGVQCLETIYQRLKIGDQISSDAELLYR